MENPKNIGLTDIYTFGRKDVTLEEISQHISYDPTTGIFTKTEGQGRALHGRLRYDGYLDVQIKINGRWRKFLLHRIAFLLMNGKWPDQIVDHKNGVRSDNRWSNLREATKTENLYNKHIHSTNRTGYKGVTWRKGRFLARITIAGKRHRLGLFDSGERAYEAYCIAAKQFFGEFARLT